MTTSDVAQRRFERWLSDSDVTEQAAARVLASALVASPAALHRALSEDLGLDDEHLLERASLDLLNRPFVERMADGYRIVEPLAEVLRNWFQESDPEAYEAVNRRMLANEVTAMETSEDDEERWFARGRVAFYLAAIDPSEAADSFIDTFAAPPPGDPGPRRSWLTDLVMRQRQRLAGESRSLEFFQGFQDYKDGRYESARSHLEAVLAEPDRDAYRAIALHLWSVLRDRDSRSERYLREAIDLSEDLALVENEVMARHTLVFRLIARGYRAKHNWPDDMREAASLADVNLGRAEASGDRYLQVWARSAMAQARWLWETDNRRRPELVSDLRAEDLIESLSDATDDAFAIGDLGSVVETVNASAQMMRDRGEIARAVNLLSRYYQRLGKLEPPLSAGRWGQTAGSLARQPMDPETRRQLQELRRLLREWSPPGSAGRHKR